MKNINFSIVSYLTNEDYKIVRDIQKEISQITGSKKCLVDWLPHITTGYGIIVSEDRLQEIENKLQEFTSNQATIKAVIKGFGGVDNWKGAVEGKVTPYVIWLDVEVGEDLMNLFNSLKDTITSKEDTWLPRTINYIPHVTIAFSDLDKEGYEKGLEYLKNKSLEREFVISHLALVECYGEGNMTSVEYKKFYFNS
jgi:2'-5' RNA ligase